MERKKFGILVRELRKEMYELNSRQALALKAHLTVRQLGKIENGQMTKLTPNTLVNLATALGLTSSERREFFAAASGVDQANITRNSITPEKAYLELSALLGQLQAPGLIVDCYGDLLAINYHLGVMYDLDRRSLRDAAGNLATRYHILRLFFADEMYKQVKMFGNSFDTFAYNAILVFRTISLQHRADPYFINVLKGLKEYRKFKYYWSNLQHVFEEGERDHFTDNPIVKLKHPQFKQLNMTATVKTHWTTHGVMRLQSFLPLDRKTQQSFNKISDSVSELDENGFIDLAKLPNQK